jgi:hypothetical protein
MHGPHISSGGRYPVLRALAILYLIGAALTVVAAIIGIIYIYARGPGNGLDRTIISIGAIVAAFYVVVSMLALAEVLKLFIDVEHNTRMTAGNTVSTPSTATAERTVAAVTTTPAMAEASPVVLRADGQTNRLAALDEETAEAALIRGH